MEPSSPGFRPELDKEHTWLRRKARRLIGGRLRGVVESQDLAQDAGLAALRQVEGKQFENRRAFRGWLARILGNRARDLARAQRGPRDEPASWSRVPGREPTPSQGLAAYPEHGDLWRALQRLPERERAVVRLRIVDELSFAELAQRLEISEGNARVIFHRSIGRLKESGAP